MEFIELDDQQRLHLVNSDQLYRAWRQARESVQQYRYGMRFVQRGDKRYLVRFIDARGNGRSLGPETEKTRQVLQQFEAGNTQARTKYDGLNKRLQTQIRLNRALRIGRLPRAAADILVKMNETGLDREFLVVGTHALYAYESMAAVHVDQGALASDDLDLCFDARRPLQLVTDKLQRQSTASLLGLLTRVDKTYSAMNRNGDGVFRAVNSQGFMVDLITPERSMRDMKPVTFGTEDLVAAEVPSLHWLINAPKIEHVTIASSGRPVMMRVPDPRAFALHKAWLSQQPTREPVKRQRDKGQAMIAVAIVGQYLPHLPFSQDDLRYLSLDMIHLATQAVLPEDDSEDFLANPHACGNDSHPVS